VIDPRKRDLCPLGKKMHPHIAPITGRRREFRPQDVGRANFCIDTSVQSCRDRGAGAVPVGANVRLTAATWDPQNPAQHVGGLGQMTCASHDDPCTESFIGDYFGVAVSAANVYVLAVSTHYPSTVTADEGGPVYYQQQVLSMVSRKDLGCDEIEHENRINDLAIHPTRRLGRPRSFGRGDAPRRHWSSRGITPVC
jgi:hypothetical protein